ncbi:MAG: hypothetical protein CALGDGBN_03556 [Pseudomonadales bacterium]|nr:hypothetical protein [Pseudomonadales bacterium]
MARIRTVKPEFFTSEDIVELSPMARLLYIALWCEADREGRMVWKPRTFKMRYLPADDCDIDSLAGEIIAAGLVILYGDGLAHIPTFARHQHVNARESASRLPAPNSDPTRSRVDDASARVDDAPVTHREEGKGKEGDLARENAPPSAIPFGSRKKKSTTLPDGFGISDRVQQWAQAKGYDRLEERLEHFLSYARRSGRTYADWDEALMSSIREDWAKLGHTASASGSHWSTQGLVL